MDGKASNDKENVGQSITPFRIPPTPLLKRIGYGTGVNVYHLDRSPLDHKTRSPWALKKVNRTHRGGEISKRMFDESQILKTLDHPNIVGFRGYTKTDDGREVLALEVCSESLGDLIEERRDSTKKRFSPQEILTVAKGMVQGLYYLHSVAHLMHGDVKSYNVLIKDKNFNKVKLCDFGISLKVDGDGCVSDKESANKFLGTAAWSAPEVVLGDGPITTKADIFSFGLTLWEMMALRPPHFDVSSFEESDTSAEWDQSVLSANETFGKRPSLPEDLSPDYKEIVKIFEWCTEEDLTKRPSAKDLITVLDRIEL